MSTCGCRRRCRLALLPRALPQVPQIEFAAEYLPASTGADVGGDFYDVVPVGPDRWLVTIGDVCGKGARAAARTGLVRDVLRALVREGRPLVRAIEMLNDVMVEAADPQQFCTLAAAMLSRARHEGQSAVAVELVLAGHAQPVVVRADGTAELIGRFGTALGLVEAVDLHCTRHLLAAGDTLLLYTDGITECRRGPEQFDDDRLLAGGRRRVRHERRAARGDRARGRPALRPRPRQRRHGPARRPRRALVTDGR